MARWLTIGPRVSSYLLPTKASAAPMRKKTVGALLIERLAVNVSHFILNSGQEKTACRDSLGSHSHAAAFDMRDDRRWKPPRRHKEGKCDDENLRSVLLFVITGASYRFDAIA